MEARGQTAPLTPKQVSKVLSTNACVSPTFIMAIITNAAVEDMLSEKSEMEKSPLIKILWFK